ncbi:MAG: hypothetical protein ACT4OI_05385 [Methanobacteriota archaeon]
MVHIITRCFSHGGLKAWEVIFTSNRILLVKKGANEALKIGAAGGLGAATGPLGAVAARKGLARGAVARRAELEGTIGQEGLEGFAASRENVVIWNHDVREIFLKDGILGAPELRILLKGGKKWTFGLSDTQRALAHFEPLRSVYGSAVRHNKRTA